MTVAFPCSSRCQNVLLLESDDDTSAATLHHVWQCHYRWTGGPSAHSAMGAVLNRNSGRKQCFSALLHSLVRRISICSWTCLIFLCFNCNIFSPEFSWELTLSLLLKVRTPQFFSFMIQITLTGFKTSHCHYSSPCCPAMFIFSTYFWAN